MLPSTIQTSWNQTSWNQTNSSQTSSTPLRPIYLRLSRTRSFALAALVLALLAVISTLATQAQDAPKRGRKYKAPPAAARVEVTVIRDSTGKPVENAAVIFHPLVDGHDSGNMELKTNDEGKAVIDILDLGSSVRLQIIAPGFQTYGEDYKVDKDNMAIEVKLKRPTEQYSIYKKNEGKGSEADKASDKSAAGPVDKPADKSVDKAKDAPPAGQPETKPDAPKDEPKTEAKPQDAASPNKS